jgi:hypothetical protein
LDFENNEQIMNIIVKNGEVPRFIYKYTDIESLKKILENSTLKFSKPSEFNDPFDCNITIDANNTTEEIDAHIELLLKNHTVTDEQIKIFHNPTLLFNLTNNEIKKSKESFGVTCFSKKFDNIVMWSHYSDKHRGVCLKFYLLADADCFMAPFIVKYNDMYPTFNYIRNRLGLAKFLLETKSIDWKYEEEIRVMKRGAGFYSFKKDSLVEIIFGAKTANSEKVNIRNIIMKFDYQKTNFKTAKISETDFKLEFEDTVISDIK